MIIKVDKEGHSIIEQLFDVALKSGGMSNFKAVVEIMDIVEIIEEPEIMEQEKV